MTLDEGQKRNRNRSGSELLLVVNLLLTINGLQERTIGILIGV